MIVTTTSLVALCSKLAALSSNQAGLGTSDFLSFANLVCMTLTSEILAAHEDYLLHMESIPVTAGVAEIRIPYRAINGEIRHLFFEKSDGSRRKLWPLEIESIENYPTTASAEPSGFYILGNHVVLLPKPSVAGNLVIIYPFRPNLLVEGSTTQTISALGSNSIVMPNTPTNFVSGVLYDIIDNRSGNGIVYYDLLGTVSGTTLIFDQDIPLAQVGMHVAQAGQTGYVMLPEEAHPLLLESTVLRIEMIRGNTARIKNSGALLQDARRAFDALLMNRVVSKAHIVGGGSPLLPGGYRP